MKKKTINKITLATALGLGAVLLISCTANFSTNKDKASIMYAYDRGTLSYTTDPNTIPDGALSGAVKAKDSDGTYKDTKLYYYQNFELDYKSEIARTLNPNDNQGVVKSAVEGGVSAPSNEYWATIDLTTLEEAWGYEFKGGEYEDFTVDNVNKMLETTNENGEIVLKTDKIIETLDDFGPLKFYNKDKDSEHWGSWDALRNDIFQNPDKYNEKYEWNNKKGCTPLSIKTVPSQDFINLYKSFLDSKVNNVRSTITITGGYFGSFGWNKDKVYMEGISWGDAWLRGFLEGLLVYPVAAMTEIFSHTFGMNGFGQLAAILLVTFIVRTFLFLVSLRSTIGQQKMQMLQPELAKIQAKYPNANTNMAQKQRMSQEQMALYKKNKINPIGTLLVLIVQFPLFIGVWGGLQGSAALATDSVWGLYLSDSIWNTLTTAAPGNMMSGWITAFFLVILMSVGQFVSMKLPQWMQKHYAKSQPKLTANPTVDKTQRQMKWFTYIMLIIIIIMGFTLPAGMGVYWLAGALFSIIQTVILQLAMHGTFKKWWKAIKRLFQKKDTIDADTSR